MKKSYNKKTKNSKEENNKKNNSKDYRTSNEKIVEIIGHLKMKLITPLVVITNKKEGYITLLFYYHPSLVY